MRLLERVIGANVLVSVNFESDLPAVYADPAQIEQVVMNLSINARDAMPDGGELTIETCSLELDDVYCSRFPYVQPGNYVCIKVSDTGTGMDAETIQHIFEPFYTTKDQGKGTGLGLSMAYGIIKQHDGHIHVQSQLGIGTTFEIFLPVDSRKVQADKAGPIQSVLGGTETILVAEDEAALRAIAKDALENLGYTVLLAKDGFEAIEMFEKHHDEIQLLLFDVVMPRMGGIHAFESINKLAPSVPLLLMTGYSVETVQSRFIQSEKSADDLGAAVIQKPFDLDALGKKVREVLNAPRSHLNPRSAPKPATPVTIPHL
jgi:CheY-like chemotaxis protein